MKHPQQPPADLTPKGVSPNQWTVRDANRPATRGCPCTIQYNKHFIKVRIYISVLKEYFLNRLSLDLIHSLHNSALIVGLEKGSSFKLKCCTCRATGPSGDSESWDISYFFIFSPNKWQLYKWSGWTPATTLLYHISIISRLSLSELLPNTEDILFTSASQVLRAQHSSITTSSTVNM